MDSGDLKTYKSSENQISKILTENNTFITQRQSGNGSKKRKGGEKGEENEEDENKNKITKQQKYFLVCSKNMEH